MNKLKLIFSTILLLTLLTVPNFAVSTWKGKCVRVTDGDTIWVKTSSNHIKIRLYGVDTPEIKQSFGKEAKEFVTSLVFLELVKVEPINKDRYGRTVALIYFEVQENINYKPVEICLNEKIVQAGYAWVYDRYCKKPICKQWKQLENDANIQKIGLWKSKTIIPPWEYRLQTSAASQPLKPNDLVGFLIIFAIAIPLLFLVRFIQKRRWKKRMKKRRDTLRDEADFVTKSEQNYFRAKLESLKNKNERR